MKTLLALACLALTGCISPKWPRDAHLKKGVMKVTTPWGGYEVTVDELDTGSAARNATEQYAKAK